MKKKAEQQEVRGEVMQIRIKPPALKIIPIRIHGITPLLCNRNGGEMLPGGPDHGAPREKLGFEMDRDKEFQRSLYTLSNKKGKYYVPAGAVRISMIDACRSVSTIKMTEASQYFTVLPDPDAGDYIEIHGTKPEVFSRPVKLNGKAGQMRHRALFREWYIDVRIQFNSHNISESEVVNLLNTAGFAVGIGDWRPQRRGTFGMFSVLPGKKESKNAKI